GPADRDQKRHLDDAERSDPQQLPAQDVPRPQGGEQHLHHPVGLLFGDPRQHPGAIGEDGDVHQDQPGESRQAAEGLLLLVGAAPAAPPPTSRRVPRGKEASGSRPAPAPSLRATISWARRGPAAPRRYRSTAAPPRPPTGPAMSSWPSTMTASTSPASRAASAD